MQHTFPKLFKRGGTGDIQEWTIRVDGNQIFTHWGKVGHTIQESAPDIVTQGKNLGKANATTPEEQAYAEAEAKWTKKLKGGGYVLTVAEATSGAVSELTGGGYWPMLAHKYKDHGDRIQFPCMAQPKLDGHRCTAVKQDGLWTLWSRKRNQITSMPHILAALSKLTVQDGFEIDGELYADVYKDNIEAIAKLARPAEPRPSHEIIQYHIFDIKADAGFGARHEVLRALFTSITDPCLHMVETVDINSEEELMAYFEGCLARGYEGAMARNNAGAYMGHPTHRSYDLQKLKEMDDGEFKVLDVKEGRGKMAGLAVFICDVGNGKTVDAKMKGKLEALRPYFENPAPHIGRMLTIQYQGFSKKNVKPRFPVALRFREDI